MVLICSSLSIPLFQSKIAERIQILFYRLKFISRRKISICRPGQGSRTRIHLALLTSHEVLRGARKWENNLLHCQTNGDLSEHCSTAKFMKWEIIWHVDNRIIHTLCFKINFTRRFFKSKDCKLIYSLKYYEDS